MKRTVFHVVGFTQFMGTCKFHLFDDCPQLTKKRYAARRWDRTGVTTTAEVDVDQYQRHVCKLCLRREQRAAPAAPLASR